MLFIFFDFFSFNFTGVQKHIQININIHTLAYIDFPGTLLQEPLLFVKPHHVPTHCDETAARKLCPSMQSHLLTSGHTLSPQQALWFHICKLLFLLKLRRLYGIAKSPRRSLIWNTLLGKLSSLVSFPPDITSLQRLKVDNTKLHTS